MSDHAPENEGDEFDVVLVGGATDDGGGAKVLRARPGRVEAGEVRPMREGKPITGGAVVRLERRPESSRLYDVKVEHEVDRQVDHDVPAHKSSPGPAQVASLAYRESWERTFGRGKSAPN